MFKLNIESTKDINELHIKFADGSSVVTTTSNNHLASTSGVPVHDVATQTQQAQRKEDFLDLDTDFGGVSQEVVKPPDIHATSRPVKVASELQNLDI